MIHVVRVRVYILNYLYFCAFVFIVIFHRSNVFVSLGIVLSLLPPRYASIDFFLEYFLLIFFFLYQFFELCNIGACRCWVHLPSITIGVTVVHALLDNGCWIPQNYLLMLLHHELFSSLLFINVFFSAWVCSCSFWNHFYSWLINFLVEQWIKCPLSVDHNDIDTCHPDACWIIYCVFDKFLFDSNFKSSIFLL